MLVQSAALALLRPSPLLGLCGPDHGQLDALLTVDASSGPLSDCRGMPRALPGLEHERPFHPGHPRAFRDSPKWNPVPCIGFADFPHVCKILGQDSEPSTNGWQIAPRWRELARHQIKVSVARTRRGARPEGGLAQLGWAVGSASRCHRQPERPRRRGHRLAASARRRGCPDRGAGRS